VAVRAVDSRSAGLAMRARSVVEQAGVGPFTAAALRDASGAATAPTRDVASDGSNAGDCPAWNPNGLYSNRFGGQFFTFHAMCWKAIEFAGVAPYCAAAASSFFYAVLCSALTVLHDRRLQLLLNRMDSYLNTFHGCRGSGPVTASSRTYPGGKPDVCARGSVGLISSP
jgi:hypothetical protein